MCEGFRSQTQRSPWFGSLARLSHGSPDRRASYRSALYPLLTRINVYTTRAGPYETQTVTVPPARPRAAPHRRVPPVASNQATQGEPTVGYQKAPEPRDLEARSCPPAGTRRLGRQPLPRRSASANYNGIGASTFNGHSLFSTFGAHRWLWEPGGTGTARASMTQKDAVPARGAGKTRSVPTLVRHQWSGIRHFSKE